METYGLFIVSHMGGMERDMNDLISRQEEIDAQGEKK